MKRKWHPRTYPPKKIIKKTSGEFLLENFNLLESRKRKHLIDNLLQYHWDYYCSFAHQRAKISEQINQALIGATKKPSALKIGNEQ